MKSVGVSIDRVDGIKKVTGQAKYVDDMKMARMLYAQVKRSPYAHAKILSIDTSEAEKLPGVKSVITGEYYKKRGGLYLEDKNFLAVGTAKFRGEAVAAVAAETLEIAQQAVDLIKVEYEELPAVTNAIEGMKPDAPIIHPDLGSYKVAPIFHPIAGTNISHHFKLRKGDVEKGFAESDYVTEHTYYVPHVQHVPIEPHVAVAQYEADGKLTVWASCQSPFAVRQALAASFDLPLNKVRVISPYVGGGFGAKAGTTLEGIVIPLSMLNCGRPVKLNYTREEEFEDSYVRQGVHIKIKTGVRKDGKILAEKVEYVWDAGAYTEYGVNIVKAAGLAALGPYDIPNAWADSYCVYTNHPVGGPYRGFGMCEIHFGLEQNLDMVAREIGISEVEIRRINGLRAGGITGTGQVLEDSGYQDCLETVVKEMDYDTPSVSPSPTKIRAKGIAGGWKSPSMPTDVASAAIIRMNEDGTFFLMTSGQDIGQGSDTALTQIAAEVLSVDPSKITIRTGDTDHTPYEWQTVASRTTYCAGNAVKLAAEDARDEILDLAQIKMGYGKRDLELRDGFVVHKMHPEIKVPISTFALGLTMPDASGIHGPLIGKGSFVVPNNMGFDHETGQGTKPVAFWTMGVNGAEVEIDTETGEIRVLKMVSCFDPGKVINPKLYDAQVEGAMVQALGTALFEELKLKDGKVLNKSFVDYKIPTADDMPELVVKVAEHAEPTGPFGARGIGEPVMVPGAPAIANAVANALGVRFYRMPITADDVLKALKEKKAQEA
ncbi:MULTISPECIES: xanthine dehydrogenase family protein molybdopterin-binding subunit [Anaerotruncus]|uniref:Xanthine dehydrogenase family protein molybdopterin-binding subunit n=1 Tax=Anaerotruncus colihominis TaxID=169435 RepID=A0A845SX30_9FIRM|nr:MULTISPECIES: xanthine dehydrogenase family protein molybdopterin-binding subunit [Anaerotruncus]MCI8492863.1 xanthine dehydrogenase family protein molybdopterin-binding subunit [Anaerotruncus sp.]MCR2024359.1 xanthine dehydrogenase family protein molybdopterin-binding subunit [Anaerotruncus colihominis]NBI79349.1 xanthine dehydrogenase family protein molybdopterin-binding subunit [Anaerotruncus colihominis]NDO39093.1 xanthine dehydrogenase family protein molybdopterin-binding subunit [Anaer